MVSERSRRPELEHPRLGTTDQFPLLRTPADEPGQGGGHRRNATKDRVSPTPQDFIKDPYVLEFLGIPDSHEFREAELEQAIIGKLQTFMLELGKGFAFVSRQQRISTQTKDFFVDLVFYNYLLKCFVLVDLKTGELTHQDIGQMDMYVRLFEDTVKGADDSQRIWSGDWAEGNSRNRALCIGRLLVA